MKSIQYFIQQHWNEWITMEFVPNDLFNKQLSDFLSESGIPTHIKPSARTINQQINKFAASRDYSYRTNLSKRWHDGFIKKVRRFYRNSYNTAPPEQPVLFQSKLSEVNVHITQNLITITAR